MNLVDRERGVESVASGAAFAESGGIRLGVSGGCRGGVATGASGRFRTERADGTARVKDFGVGRRERQLLRVVDMAHVAVVPLSRETDMVKRDGGAAKAKDRVGSAEFMPRMDLVNHGPEVNGFRRALGGGTASSVGTGGIVA